MLFCRNFDYIPNLRNALPGLKGRFSRLCCILWLLLWAFSLVVAPGFACIVQQLCITLSIHLEYSENVHSVFWMDTMLASRFAISSHLAFDSASSCLNSNSFKILIASIEFYDLVHLPIFSIVTVRFCFSYPQKEPATFRMPRTHLNYAVVHVTNMLVVCPCGNWIESNASKLLEHNMNDWLIRLFESCRSIQRVLASNWTRLVYIVFIMYFH